MATIQDSFINLRNDFKTWITNNLRLKANKSSLIASNNKEFQFAIENGVYGYIVNEDGTDVFRPFNSYDDKYEYNYTGDIQRFTVPKTGTYKLEAWGAQGGNGSICVGGLGGYAAGEAYLTEGTVLYIVIGGSGGKSTANTNIAAGGYNGGGIGKGNASESKFVGGGGGATHIATKLGLLSNLSGDKASILIVAGGGGGAGAYKQRTDLDGGTGGGLTGGKHSETYNGSSYPNGNGGTQGAGGAGGSYNSAAGSFGQGGDKVIDGQGAGGGGGLYGGSTGLYYNGPTGGGGGSAYVDNLHGSTTINGINKGDGKAIITFLTSDPINLDSVVLFNTHDNVVETRRWYRATSANNGWGKATCQTAGATATWNQIDCTGYSKCTVRIKGEVTTTPSGATVNNTDIKIGFTDSHSDAVKVVNKWTNTSDADGEEGQNGLAYNKWYDLEINIVELTGIQTLNVFIGGAYSNGGYLYCSKITMNK